MVEVALDFDLLSQLFLHLILRNHCLLDHLQCYHHARGFILSLEHITELPSTQELPDLESITNRLGL